MEINSTVSPAVGHHVDPKVEIGERFRITHIKEVSGFPTGDKCAIFQFPGIGMIDGSFPAIKALSIAQKGESGFDFRSSKSAGSYDYCASHNHEAKVAFHKPHTKRVKVARKKNRIIE